jgi:hypothetical protein
MDQDNSCRRSAGQSCGPSQQDSLALQVSRTVLRSRSAGQSCGPGQQDSPAVQSSRTVLQPEQQDRVAGYGSRKGQVRKQDNRRGFPGYSRTGFSMFGKGIELNNRTGIPKSKKGGEGFSSAGFPKFSRGCN